MVFQALKDLKVSKEKKENEVYPVYPVKKVTEDDPVNQACQVIPVYPVSQAHEVQKVYPAVMDVTEQKEKVVDQDTSDRPVVPVNLVFLANEVQKVNQPKLYPDTKVKWALQEHPVIPVLLVHQVALANPVFQALLVLKDVKVLKVIVVTQAFQALPELDSVVKKVKKENQAHLLPMYHKVVPNYKVTLHMFHYQLLVPLVKKEHQELKVNLVRLVTPVPLVLLVHQV